MNWRDFKREASELAELGEKRFESTGVVLVGTLRRNGYPRISLRDPRCVLHSTVTNRDGREGDFKVYGRAVEVRDLETRRRYCEALFAKIGWRPQEPEFHVFALDVESVGYVVFEDGKISRKTWSPGGQP